jgi:hypothetical protein
VLFFSDGRRPSEIPPTQVVMRLHTQSRAATHRDGDAHVHEACQQTRQAMMCYGSLGQMNDELPLQVATQVGLE